MFEVLARQPSKSGLLMEAALPVILLWLRFTVIVLK